MLIDSLSKLQQHIQSEGNVTVGTDGKIYSISAAMQWFRERLHERSWRGRMMILANREELKQAVITLIRSEHADFIFLPPADPPRSARELVLCLLEQIPGSTREAAASGQPEGDGRSRKAKSWGFPWPYMKKYPQQADQEQRRGLLEAEEIPGWGYGSFGFTGERSDLPGYVKEERTEVPVGILVDLGEDAALSESPSGAAGRTDAGAVDTDAAGAAGADTGRAGAVNADTGAAGGSGVHTAPGWFVKHFSMKSLKICSEKPQTESLFPSPQRTGGQARGAEGGISVASGGERREQASPTPEYSDEEDGIELSPDSEKGLAPGAQGASGGLTGTPPDSEKVFGCAVPVSPIATRDAEVCAGAAGRRAEGQKIVLKRSEKKPAQKFSAGEQAVLSLNIFFSNDALLRKSLNRQITAYLEGEWEKSKSSSIHPDFIHTPENKMVDYIESKPVVVEDFGEKSPGQYVLDLFSKDKNLQFCLSCLSPSTGLLTILQSEIQKTEQQELSALSHLIAEGKVCLNKLNVKWIKWDNASVWIELAFSADRNYLEEGEERKHTLAQGTLYALITPSGEGQRPGVEVSGLHIQGSPASRRSNTAFKVC